MRRRIRSPVLILGFAILVAAYLVRPAAEVMGSAGLFREHRVLVAVLVLGGAAAAVVALLLPGVGEWVTMRRRRKRATEPDRCARCGYPQRSVPSRPVAVDGIHVIRPACPECGYVKPLLGS